MSAISSKDPNCLVIYTSINDSTFNHPHLIEHTTVLQQVYKVEYKRTGIFSESLFQSHGRPQKYQLIEIAAHGGEDHVNLGNEKLTMGFAERGKLEQLVSRLKSYGVLLLQTCRSGAEVSNGRCFAEYLASLSKKPIRVIANQGTFLDFEFKRLNPLEVRFMHHHCDQTACFYRRPDGKVVRVNLGVVDRLQEKLNDPIDLEMAYRLAAGFGDQEMIQRFKNLSFTIHEFKGTRWDPLFQSASSEFLPNLLKLAVLDRYGAVLQYLDIDSRRKAMIALFGSCPDLEINMRTFPEYLLRCLEIEGAFPQALTFIDFGDVVGGCKEHYEHDLPQLLENMSAISTASSEQHALLIYTRTNDKTFDDNHFEDHRELLGRVFMVESTRTGMLDKPLFQSLGSSRRFAVIEIASHGGEDHIDLGDERLTMELSKRGKLRELVQRLNAHGVLVLQTCRSGAVVSNGKCFAEYLAQLSDKPIRVIANQGRSFKLEFRRSNPVDVRYVNEGCDQTAWFYRRPDGRVVRMDLDLVDRLQKKLVDPIDHEFAYRIAAGFGVDDFIKRLSELKLSIDDFKETRWYPLFEGASDAVRGNLLKLAILNRYGAILQHLDVDHRRIAMTALFGDCPDLSINMETFPEYLLCCLEIEGAYPEVLRQEDFGVVVGGCKEHYAHDLRTLLENMTIDVSTFQGTVWESYFERLAHHKDKLGGADHDEPRISPDHKRGEVVEKEGVIRFGNGSSSAYKRCQRNLLALAAVERYKGLFIHLDNGMHLLDNPAGKAFCKMTGWIAHPRELPFARSLSRGTTSVFALIERAFQQVDRESVEEFRLLRGPISSMCMNKLYSDVSNSLHEFQLVETIGSFDDLIAYTARVLRQEALYVLNLNEVPARYYQNGFVAYHKKITVEEFVWRFRCIETETGLSEGFEESRIKEAAIEWGYLRMSDLRQFFMEEQLKDYLLQSPLREYHIIARKIIRYNGVEVNQKIDEIKGSPTPLHVAAKEKDWNLIALLFSLGARVDELDDDGFTPRHYAKKRCFMLPAGRIPNSRLKMLGDNATFKDLLNFRKAVGTYDLYWSLKGRKRPLFVHLWESLFINRPEEEITAAEMLRCRVRVNGKMLYSLGKGIKEIRMNRIIRFTNACIELLSEQIRQDPDQIEDRPIVKQALEFYVPLINHLGGGSGNFSSDWLSTMINDFSKSYQRKVLEKLGLTEEPSLYSQNGFVEYHREMTRKKLLAEFRNYLTQLNFPKKLDRISFDYITLETTFHPKYALKRFFEESRLKEYLLGSDRSEYQEIARVIFEDRSMNVNQRLGESEQAPTLLHIAAKYQDQQLITFLINLGAHVDEVDEHGFTPRHYARGCSFLPLHLEKNPCHRLPIYQKDVSFEEVLQLKDAVGSYKFGAYIRMEYKPIFDHLLDSFSINGLEVEKGAAELIMNRIKLGLEKFNFQETEEIDEERMDRVITHMKACVESLSEFFRSNFLSYIFRERLEVAKDDKLLCRGIERHEPFAYHWMKLNESMNLSE